MSISELGESGEQEARARLERALQGTGIRFSGASDKGIDLVVQFEAPSADRQPLHFGVQVKTGASFAKLEKRRWIIQNLSPERFAQWKRSHLPVIFLWVRPTIPAECYWSLVRRTTQREHFSISCSAEVSPILRYDLALEMARQEAGDGELPTRLLRPPLRTGLRDYAKSFYRQHLLGQAVQHPVVGRVEFTWRGWRHLTRQGRPQRHVHQSLQLLAAVYEAVSRSRQFVGVRRLQRVTRGNWISETRLLIFKGPVARFVDRAPAQLVIALRETIQYPVGWSADVKLHEHIRRTVIFESIYEKIPK